MDITLGKLEKIDDLRSVWSNEATDFTVWLAESENLSLLGDTLGMDIELIGREESAGAFSIDILAEESGTGRKVIIENQLESTNHDHLGKIITYASVKNAETIVWIVKKARDEHRQAIEWLNEKTDENIGFYLLEIELWRIGDSKIAPKFSIITAPNDFVKNNKSVPSNVGETRSFFIKYWENLSGYLEENYSEYHLSTSKILPRSHIGIKYNKQKVILGLVVSPQKRQIGAYIYFHSNIHDMYYRMCKDRATIDAEFSDEVTWREGKNMAITVLKSVEPKDEEDWQNQFRWFCESCRKLKAIRDKYKE